VDHDTSIKRPYGVEERKEERGKQEGGRRDAL
jgi:hypothetical protein